MSDRLEKSVLAYVHNYRNAKGSLWRVCLPDGRGGQVRRQGFPEKSDAIAFAKQEYLKVLTQNKGVKAPSALKITFGEYAVTWLEQKRKAGLAESSAMKYQEDIEKRIVPFFGPLKLSDIEKVHLRNFIRDLQDKGVSSFLIETAVTLFKSMMKQAEADDLVGPKGIERVPTPKHRSKDPVFWDSQQMNFFVNATKDHPMHDLWTLTLFTGMRAGEIAGLQWDCVHLDRRIGDYEGFIEVRRSYNQKTRKMQNQTKNGDRRTIPLLPEAAEVLRRRLAVRNGDFVFGGTEPMDSSHFNRPLQAVLRKFPQLPRVSFHGLRHSFCSYLEATGMARRVVSGIMGHRDLNTTNRYSHVSDQALSREVARWLEGQVQQKSNKLAVVG